MSDWKPTFGERLERWWRWVQYIIRVSFVVTDMHGFDTGIFVWNWRRYGPFLFYREMLSSSGNPPPLGGWRLAIFFRQAALEEFYEASTK